MSTNPRETQFQGFAKLLFDELNTQSLLAFPTMYGPDHTPEQHKELKALIEHIIAQHAYDLVKHAVEECESQESAFEARMTSEALLRNIPDMINWPEN